MRKLTILTLILMTLSAFPKNVKAELTCLEKADGCYARCDKNFSGDTFWDGASRNICKGGCAVAEAGCTIASWF